MKVEAERMFAWVCEELERGRRVSVRVSGGSMRPFLREGDVVVLEKRERYGVDDIVLARTDAGVMMHAVVGRGVVMGTANLQRRERVECVAGRVCAVVRDGKRVNVGGAWWRVAMWGWRVGLPLRRGLLRVVGWF